MALGEIFSQFSGLLFGGEDLLRNRRHQPRLALDLPVMVALEDRQVLAARVCDFGANGLRLQGSVRLARGRKVQVMVMADSGLEGSPSLSCRVAWCRPHEGAFQIGCSYDDTAEVLATSWVQMLLIERHQRGQERRDRRVEATFPATLQNGDGPAQEVFVLDLSLGGARVYSAEAWAPGAQPQLLVGLPGKKAQVDFAVEVVEARALESAGFSYRLRFLDPDARRLQQLRRILMQLLDGVRKAGRQRPPDLIPQPSAAPAPVAPERALGGAVQRPKEKSARKRSGVSSYLMAPELPVRPVTPEPELVAPVQPPQQAEVEVLPTSRLAPRSIQQIQPALYPNEPRIRKRGWLTAALSGWYPRVELPSDFAGRPTRDWLHTQVLASPGALSMLAVMQWHLDTALEHGFAVGPGLIWSDRHTFTRWWMARRGLLGWVEHGLRVRERLERRSSNLRQKAYQLLSLLGCGGSDAVRQLLVCARLCCGMAKHSGIEDPAALEQLRLAALLKDIGEAVLVIGGQQRAVRDQYLLHLNGLEHGDSELAELLSSWSGFDTPAELHVDRLRIDGTTVEMLPCHPYIGDRLLERLGFPVEVRAAVRCHHEAWSGAGHPEGLRESEIPWSARCLAVADGFASAMTYLNDPEKAFLQTSQLESTFYDPALITALRAYLSEVRVLP